MSDDYCRMQWHMRGDKYLVMQWTKGATAEDLEKARVAIGLQLDAAIKSATRKQAAQLEYESWFSTSKGGAAPTQKEE